MRPFNAQSHQNSNSRSHSKSPTNTNSSVKKISPQKQKKGLKQIQIDDQWICQKSQTPKQLMQCPICFNIVTEPVQCKNCERLVCKDQYQQIKGLKNCCPLCKCTPWEAKPNVHLMYRHMFQLQIFQCQICQNKKNYSLSKLKQHLQSQHSVCLKRNCRQLVKYQIKMSPNNTKILKLYQNLQINKQKSQGKNRFNMLDIDLGQIKIDLSSMTVKFGGNNANVDGKLQVIDDDTQNNVNASKQFTVWEFMCGTNSFQYMLDEHQAIVQQAYQEYLKQPTYNQVILDLKNVGIRYKIDFDQMTQINVKTKFERPIRRTKSMKFDQI